MLAAARVESWSRSGTLRWMRSRGLIASTSAGWGLTPRPPTAEEKMLVGRNPLLELPVRLPRPPLLEHDVGELAGGIPAVRRQAGVPVPKLRSQHGFTWVVHPGSLRRISDRTLLAGYDMRRFEAVRGVTGEAPPRRRGGRRGGRASVAVGVPPAPSFDSDLACGAQSESAAGARPAKLGWNPSADRTFGQRVVHAFYLGVVRLICFLHFTLPPGLGVPVPGPRTPTKQGVCRARSRSVSCRPQC